MLKKINIERKTTTTTTTTTTQGNDENNCYRGGKFDYLAGPDVRLLLGI